MAPTTTKGRTEQGIILQHANNTVPLPTNAQERASVNARRKHDDNNDNNDVPKPRQKQKHVVRPDGDNVSPRSRDTKSKRDSRHCYARSGND